MTLDEWTAQITKDLEAAGFVVKNHSGLPLVKRPATMEETIRLLETKLSLSTLRSIYAEGMLFTPYGINPEAGRPR